MVCEKCGKERGDTKFCTGCGHQFGESITAGDTPESRPAGTAVASLSVAGESAPPPAVRENTLAGTAAGAPASASMESAPPARKSKKPVIAVIAVIAALCIAAGGIAAYMMIFSPEAQYYSQIKQAYAYLDGRNSAEAVLAFEKAIQIDPESVEARMGASEAHIAAKGWAKAERLLKEVIKLDEKHKEAYNQLLEALIAQEKADEANALLLELEEKNIRVAAGVKPEPPEADLESGAYEQEETVQLSAGAGSIYYTTDGTAPTKDSLQYSDGIILQEGDNVIRAVAVMENGIYSEVREWTYTYTPSLTIIPTVFECIGQTYGYIEEKVGPYRGNMGYDDDGFAKDAFGNLPGVFYIDGLGPELAPDRRCVAFSGPLGALVKSQSSQITIKELDKLFTRRGELKRAYQEVGYDAGFDYYYADYTYNNFEILFSWVGSADVVNINSDVYVHRLAR